MTALSQSAPNDAGQRVDPILFEVIRNALVEVTEEMSVSLQRTAFSTNVKTRLDYSSAFVDADGRMVAQALPADRAVFPPWGLFGGGDGRTS